MTLVFDKRVVGGMESGVIGKDRGKLININFNINHHSPDYSAKSFNCQTLCLSKTRTYTLKHRMNMLGSFGILVYSQIYQMNLPCQLLATQTKASSSYPFPLPHSAGLN